MLVRNRMSSKVITVEPEHTVAQARALLQRHRIRQLPVLRAQKLVGVLTDRDLGSAPPTAQTVADLMTAKPITIGPDASVDEAARLLRTHRFGALPVLDGGRLVGILTASDILDAFVDLSGVGDATFRIIVSGAKGKPAEQRVREIIQAGRGELRWLQPDSRKPNTLHLRLKARRIDDIVTALEAAGFEVASLVAPSASQG